MIKEVTDIREIELFVSDFIDDARFSDPMLKTAEQIKINLVDSIANADVKVWCIYNKYTVLGVFTFLITPDEKYMEMLVGLPRETRAYQEVFCHLCENYAGFHCDFVFNPQNYILKRLLTDHNAAFEPEQLKLEYSGQFVPSPVKHTIVPYSDSYRSGYIATHATDVYWTAEKVLESANGFKTYLAVEKNKVVGYIDVTCCFEANEIYGLRVPHEYRNKGYECDLLKRAIEGNANKGMMAYVDVDDVDAVDLYLSNGFRRKDSENNLTARLVIGKQQPVG